MKDPKEHNIVWTVCLLGTLLMTLAAAVAAQDGRGCSAEGVSGQWGYSETGTVMTPNGPVPYSSLGRYTLDSEGNYSGSRTATLGGAIQKANFTGHATVNDDCTGTVTINFYDPSSGALLSTAVKALVYMDNERAVRAIVTSAVFPNGTSIPTVLTTDGKKLFPGHQE